MNGKTEIKTIETEHFTMDYFRFGSGEKTLVILPGLSVDSVMKYADAIASAYGLFAEDYTVYVFDRRKELPASYSVYDMAQDTAAAIRALGLNRVCVFGASQGGMIAMEMAVGHPELVSKLVLGSSAARIEPEQEQLLSDWIRLAKNGDAERLYLTFGEAIYPQNVFEQAREMLAESAKGVTGEDLSRFVILAEGMKGFDVLDRLQDIACPVLVIGSLDDQVLGTDASEKIAEALKDRQDCKLYLYNGYGHAAYDLAPDYKERMLRFLS